MTRPVKQRMYLQVHWNATAPVYRRVWDRVHHTVRELVYARVDLLYEVQRTCLYLSKVAQSRTKGTLETAGPRAVRWPVYAEVDPVYEAIRDND